ncbi:MAG: metallophosphoesterase [Candidatus Marinimicrobia bacterium]|nr:metallophosphoesterase [Candidatus Neomarinimicrobiota bacterium]MDD5582366.1 metallophosphoesterase [Candidatus Neomarinimicrobiota bacterium]
MRHLILGDIHGQYNALIRVLKKADYDPKVDILYCVGDLTDRGPDSAKVVEFCINHGVLSIRGNHDMWFLDYLRYGYAPMIWLSQGGYKTLISFQQEAISRDLVLTYYKKMPYYREISEGGLSIAIVHGGIEPGIPLKDQNPEILTWDRNFWLLEQDPQLPYDRYFLGHTPLFGSAEINRYHVINLDTGAGYYRKLTAMDMISLEKFEVNI